MLKKNRIFIKTEDKYGCCTVIERAPSLLIENHFKRYETPQLKRGLSNPGIFRATVIEKSTIKYDYLILVFDLDSLNSSEANGMITFDEIYQIFDFEYRNKKRNSNEDRAQKSKGINITDIKSVTGKYIGDKVILLPVFFCFESIFFYSNALFSTIPSVEIKDFIKDQQLILAPNFKECPLAYKSYFNIPPQFKIKEAADSMLRTKFPFIKDRDIREKKTPNIITSIEKKEDYKNFVKDDIIKNIIYKSVFNKPFGELLNISTDEEIDLFLEKYCFKNYQDELKNIMSLYNNMISWKPKIGEDFRRLKWYKDYRCYVNSMYNKECSDRYMRDIDLICYYFTA